MTAARATRKPCSPSHGRNPLRPRGASIDPIGMSTGLLGGAEMKGRPLFQIPEPRSVLAMVMVKGDPVSIWVEVMLASGQRRGAW